MLFRVKNKFGDTRYQLDEYHSDEEVIVQHADIDWDKVPLYNLCNSDIVCKIKYHAALHNKSHLFKLSDRLFRPTIPENVAFVREHPESILKITHSFLQDFLSNFAPKQKDIARIPQNGLPYDDAEIHVQSDAVSAATTAQPPAPAREKRNVPPTEFGASNFFSSIWNFTNRFDSSDRNQTRILIMDRLHELDREVRSKETRHVAEADLRRRFSRRDLFMNVDRRK